MQTQPGPRSVGPITVVPSMCGRSVGCIHCLLAALPTRERTPFPRTGPHSESLAHKNAAVVVAQLQTSGDAGLKTAEVLGDVP